MLKKKNMDIKLYKFEVIKGKESVAEEWLNFIGSDVNTGELLLKKEKAYFEAYFKSVENDTMYIYMFFSADNVEFSNNSAYNQGTDLDKKHFAYMRECIDLTKGDIMDCLFYFNNVEDAIEA